MNSILHKVLIDNSPDISENVVNGLATKIIPEAPAYLDKIIKSVFKSAPEGFRYLGYRKLSPDEVYNSLFSGKNKTVVYNIAKNNLYTIELIFDYEGSRIKRHLLLPYVLDGGIITLSDTKYHIVPVMSDTVISVGDNEVFIKLLRDKTNVYRDNKNIKVNGKVTNAQILYSNLCRAKVTSAKTNLSKTVTPLSGYVLGDLGLVDSFKRYLNITPIFTTAPISDADRADYIVYESNKIKPKSLKDNKYEGHDFKILIDINAEIHKPTLLENFIAGIFYMLDIFPAYTFDLMTLLQVESPENKRKEILLWRMILGRLAYKDYYSLDRVYTLMEEHFSIISCYNDEWVKSKLTEIGIRIETFFDLLVEVLDRFNIWLLERKESNNTIDKRYLDIPYYILCELIIGINKTVFETKRKKERGLSETEVINIFNKNLSPTKIFKVMKSSGMNIALMLVDSTSDNKYAKITSIFEEQSRGNGVTRGTNNQFPEATRHIASDDIIVGSFLYLGKNNPSPKFRANLFVNVDVKSGRVITTEQQKKTIAKLDTMLKGKVDATGDNVNMVLETDDDFITASDTK
jgi:hypothetical protein